MREYTAAGFIGLLLMGAVLGISGCGEEDTSTAPVPRGDFTVRTVTAGSETDSEYGVAIDDIFARTIGPNDSSTWEGVSVDTYSLELVEVADNCVVEPENPRFLTLIADSLVETTFSVECFEATGILRVVTATTGPDPDDSYSLAVDGTGAGTIAANDTVLTGDLLTGDHTLELGGIAVNCVLAGDPVRTVRVPSEGLVTSTFEVFCTDEVGDLRIITRSEGLGDPSGYEFVVELADPIAAGANDTVTVASVAAGVARVSLVEDSVDPPCVLDGLSSRSLDIRIGEVSETIFTFSCEGP
jgi:hypothetical protein